MFYVYGKCTPSKLELPVLMHVTTICPVLPSPAQIPGLVRHAFKVKLPNRFDNIS